MFTQTHRQYLTNRTMAMLFNRLAANDTLDAGDVKFKVSIGGKEVARPDELVQRLKDTGHKVGMRFRFNIVSFGNGFCIKEDDGTWTNIPWAIVLRSGYEDRHRRSAYSFLNHGGTTLDVEGPIMTCCVAHHIAIDGFVGWYTTENFDVPWLSEIQVGDYLSPDDTIRAVRFCGLYAAGLNFCARRCRLPAGGYGLFGVCLDSTAIIEKALFGKVNTYPCMHIGRFRMHAVRDLRDLLATFEARKDDRVEDMRKIVQCKLDLPNDACATPLDGPDAARRMIQCMPRQMPFKIMHESVEACKDILAEAEEMAKQ